MKNKSVWLAHAAAWISTATAVIFAIKYTGSAWCLVALMLPAMQKISISDEENMEFLSDAMGCLAIYVGDDDN